MTFSSTLDRLHAQVKQNRWLRYFAVFNRIALAAGFLPSGFVKIMGERFTSLSVNHPMGNYLEALHHTGYYYTFIGVVQVTAALLLLIPVTATLGAVLYFPVILNICILSFAVRFDGSLFSAPLMVLANLYLLCWDYDRLKYIFPFGKKTVPGALSERTSVNATFPVRFFSGVFVTVVLLELAIATLYDIRPFNTIGDCQTQCRDSKNPEACEAFCDCIHKQGQPLNKCLDDYTRASEATRQTP